MWVRALADFPDTLGAATANSDRWRCCGQSGGLEVCRAVTHTNTARIDESIRARMSDNRTIKWSG